MTGFVCDSVGFGYRTDGGTTEALRDRLRRKPEKRAGKRPEKKPARTRTAQTARHPVRSGRSSDGYGDGRRNQGRRARTLEGQRYG